MHNSRTILPCFCTYIFRKNRSNLHQELFVTFGTAPGQCQPWPWRPGGRRPRSSPGAPWGSCTSRRSRQRGRSWGRRSRSPSPPRWGCPAGNRGCCSRTGARSSRRRRCLGRTARRSGRPCTSRTWICPGPRTRKRRHLWSFKQPLCQTTTFYLFLCNMKQRKDRHWARDGIKWRNWAYGLQDSEYILVDLREGTLWMWEGKTESISVEQLLWRYTDLSAGNDSKKWPCCTGLALMLGLSKHSMCLTPTSYAKVKNLVYTHFI